MVLLCDLGKITPSLGLNSSIFRMRGAPLDGPSRLPSETTAGLGAPTRGPQTVGKHRTLGASLGGPLPRPPEEETLVVGRESGKREGPRRPGGASWESPGPSGPQGWSGARRRRGAGPSRNGSEKGALRMAAARLERCLHHLQFKRRQTERGAEGGVGRAWGGGGA